MAVDDKFVNIKDLRPGMKNVTCVFIVIDKGTTNQTKDGSVVRKCRVADRSGSVSFSLWNEQAEAIEPGDILKLTKGYASIWKDSMTLYSGKYGRLEKIGDFADKFSERAISVAISVASFPGLPRMSERYSQAFSTFTMVFSELPDLSDPNQEFVLQHQRQNSSTVAGNRDKSGPNRGGIRMGPGSAARAGHGGTRPGLGGGGTRTGHTGYDTRPGPGINGTRMGPSGLAGNRNGNNQMGMAIPTITPTHIHGAETSMRTNSPASISQGPLSHPKPADSSQPSTERTSTITGAPPDQRDLKQARLPSTLPNHHGKPPPPANPGRAHLSAVPARPPLHPASFQPGPAPQCDPRQQILNVQRPPGPLPHPPPPRGGYSPHRGMLLQPRAGAGPQFRPRAHQPGQNTAVHGFEFPGTGPNVRAPNPPSRYQPYPPCRPPVTEKPIPPGGWR